MKKLFALCLLVISSDLFANDWGGSWGVIENMYMYPERAVIVSGAP
jgi:hypothetical protein